MNREINLSSFLEGNIMTKCTNLVSFSLKTIASLSLLLMVSSPIQAEERAPIERPSAIEVEKKIISISIPSNSSAKNVEASIRTALEKNGYKPSARDRRSIQSAARKAAKGSAGSSRWTITIRFRCCTIVISSK